jgi:hypothetical protein
MKELIIALVAAIGGGLVTLIAPWIKWNLKERQEKKVERAKLIAEVRSYIGNHPDFDTNTFSGTILYSRIRPYLPDAINQDYDQLTSRIVTVIGPLRDDPANQLLDALAELEIKWNLI